MTEIRERCIDRFTWKLATDVTNTILRVNYLESTVYVLLLTGFTLFVTDFKVQPSQLAVQSETSVDSRTKVQVPFYKISTASEKKVRYFIVGANCTEQQDGTISLTDVTGPPDIFLKLFANDKLDALFYIFIYYTSVHVSSITVLIIRRSNWINTSYIQIHCLHVFVQNNAVQEQITQLLELSDLQENWERSNYVRDASLRRALVL